MSSVGDLARSFTLRNQTNFLKAQLDARSAEMTTGRTQDAGRAVKGDFTPLNGIEATLARLAAYKASTTEATLTTDAMQSALSSVSNSAVRLSSTLLAVALPGNPTSVNAVGKDAMAQFNTAVATFNIRVGDRSIFAGTETRTATLAPAATILDALVVAVNAATPSTAEDVVAAVTAWFNDPAGYSTVGYLGGAPLDPLGVADGESVQLDATAADPGIRDTLKGLALAALLDRGVLAGETDQRARLATRAGEALVEGATSRSLLTARIGTAEERIATAITRNGAESTLLEFARQAIVSIDPYEAATALTEAEAQLDTLYTVTARLSRLSLSNYL